MKNGSVNRRLGADHVERFAKCRHVLPCPRVGLPGSVEAVEGLASAVRRFDKLRASKLTTGKLSTSERPRNRKRACSNKSHESNGEACRSPKKALPSQAAAQTCNTLVVVEDHYYDGGLGDAVLNAVVAHGIAVHKLAVTDVPRSGKPEELLDACGISARRIVETVKSLASK